MANMSYCRFENTFDDFRDCYYAVGDAYNLRDMELSKSEYDYMLSLAEMARRFANDVDDLVKRAHFTDPDTVDKLTA